MAKLDDFGKLDHVEVVLPPGWFTVFCCLTEFGVVTGRVFVPEVVSVKDSRYLGILALPAGV